MQKIMEAVGTAMILFVTGLLLWSFGRQDFRYQRYETDTIHYVKARTMEVLEQELTEGFRLNSVLYSCVIVSAMGAVMDVAVSMGASLGEIASLNPGLSGRELVRSGMRIGRDMTGTMTNTLILAFAGSSLATLLVRPITPALEAQ